MKGVRALFGAELRRFFSRRVMRGAFAFGIALSTLVLVILTVNSDIRTVTEHGNRIVCEGQPGGVNTGPVGPNQLPPGCTEQVNGARVRHDHRLRVGANYSDTVKGTGFGMVFVAFVLGASFIGAEFGAGSLSTQLLYEPRRVRVVVTKAVAVGVGLALMAITLLLYIGLLQWAGSSLRGIVSGLDSTWFLRRAGDVGRVAAATGLAGTATYAITVVTRRTVAAVAALLVTGWASAIIGHLARWHWLAKYNPATAFIELVADDNTRNNTNPLLAVRPAALSASVWVVGLVAGAAIIFRRREVR